MQRFLGSVMTGVMALACACAAEPSDDVSSDAPAAQLWGGELSGKETAAPFGCEGSRIALQTFNGRNYLTAVVGGGFAMMANASRVGPAETFRVYDLGNDRVALRVSNGQYMVAAGGGGLLLNANASRITADVAFELLNSSDGKRIRLRARNGQWVTAEGGGGNVANVGWPIAGDNQKFTAICVNGSSDSSSNADESGSDPWGGGDDNGDSGSDDSDWGDDGARPGLGG
ncbi:MAG: hypothetical protein ABW252_12835 [Polyangiales bacterium]